MADWPTVVGPSLGPWFEQINRFEYSWKIKYPIFYPVVSHTNSTVLYNAFDTLIEAVWKTLVCNILYNTNNKDFSKFHNLSVSLRTFVYIKDTYLLHNIVYNNYKTLRFK